MAPAHTFRATVTWTGARGSGTSSYRDYGREHIIRAPGKPEIAGSSAPVFRGDTTRWNPEELLVASLSGCHLLWYLHFCADRGIVVVDYHDEPEGTMEVAKDGSGRFTAVLLRPHVTLAKGDPTVALGLHEDAHRMCFIANSVNFPVRHEAMVVLAPSGSDRAR
jgi:organic hydroperoxide reductase OsmC/OhrA